VLQSRSASTIKCLYRNFRGSLTNSHSKTART
jgi:hypothetical protein